MENSFAKFWGGWG